MRLDKFVFEKIYTIIVLLLECHFVATLLLIGLNHMINTKVTGTKVVPSAFSIELIELGPKLLWWFIVFYLVHAIVILLVKLVHVVPANFYIFKHYVVLLESFVKEFLSLFVLWVV